MMLCNQYSIFWMKKMTNNIYLETNSGLIEYLNSNYTSDTLFIIDSNLSDINIDEKVNARVSYFEIKEDTKNLASVEKIWDLLLDSVCPGIIGQGPLFLTCVRRGLQLTNVVFLLDSVCPIQFVLVLFVKVHCFWI